MEVPFSNDGWAMAHPAYPAPPALKRSDIGIDYENTLPEEEATEQNEPFPFRLPEIQEKLGPGERDEIGPGNNSNPANETSLRLSSRIRKAP